MAGIAFNMFAIDTLQFSERLIKEGMEPKLAKVLVEEVKEIGDQFVDGLATKADLQDIKMKLKNLEMVLKNVEMELRGEIRDVRKDLQISIQNLLIKLDILIIGASFAVAGFIAWYLDKIISGHFPLH